HERVVLANRRRRFLARDRAVEAALRRIVLEQVRQVVGRNQVVDGDHVERLAERALLHQRAEHEPADAAETVDADLDCHDKTPQSREKLGRTTLRTGVNRPCVLAYWLAAAGSREMIQSRWRKIAIHAVSTTTLRPGWAGSCRCRTSSPARRASHADA